MIKNLAYKWSLVLLKKRTTCINILNSKCLNIITITFFFPGIKILKKPDRKNVKENGY